jgi:hypothetical protein
LNAAGLPGCAVLGCSDFWNWVAPGAWYGGGPTCDPLKSENHPTTQYFAITAAWAGDKELALQQLEAGLRAPAASLMLSYGALRLHPLWNPFRGDPRFEKIVASLAPKERH